MTQRFGQEVGATRRLRRGTAIVFGVAVIAAVLAGGSASSDTKAMKFKGRGVKTLPAFRVAGPSTLVWTNSGSFFQLSSVGDYCYEAAVQSDEHEGSTYVAAGLYPDLRVRAIGAWTITIRRGVERPSAPISFSGLGESGLAPFRLRSAKTMYWTNTGDRFQMISMPRQYGVLSSGLHRGKMRLRAGYHRFVVDASSLDGPMGSWRIVIR